MNLKKIIQYLYPNLKNIIDYEVAHNNKENQYLIWNREDIEKPTEKQIQETNLIILEQERQAKIRQEIADTILEFTTIGGVTGKFKIRKKDFAPIIAQFMDVKENSIEPINVLDYYYNSIPFTYQDFLNFKALVSYTQTQILINNQ